MLHQGRDKQCAAAAKFMAGAARRLAIVGTPLELQGTKLDGTPLDWQAYRGKVVLVQFWTGASRDFPALLAHTRQTYELYRDRGFNVLGINLDLDRGQLGQFVAADEVPWTVLPDESSGANSMAIRYGIASIAMTILVGKDGKVAAIDTEGQGLDKHLRELLGPAAAGPLTCIDLRSKGNWKLDETVPGFAENNLDPLPRGKQDFAGLTFQVGAAAMRLAGQLLQSEPIAIEAIPVNATAADLFFLHATQWGALPPDQVAKGTPIGEFTVHYDDGFVVSIPILYGRDVRDWVDHDHGRPTTRSTVVWRGMNRSTARNNEEIRLYLSVLEESAAGEEDRQPGLCLDDDQGRAVCVAITAAGPSSSTPGNEVALGTGTTEHTPKNNSVPGPADPEPTRTKGFRVALEQLDKAIQEHPDDLSALQARLNINAVAANWREVEADFTASSPLPQPIGQRAFGWPSYWHTWTMTPGIARPARSSSIVSPATRPRSLASKSGKYAFSARARWPTEPCVPDRRDPPRGKLFGRFPPVAVIGASDCAALSPWRVSAGHRDLGTSHAGGRGHGRRQ